MSNVKAYTFTANPPFQLPLEILRDILKHTVPLLGTYDPEGKVGPENVWTTSLTTRKAVTLVCKAWCGPATEALYCDIIIRQPTQIRSLAHALRGPDNLMDAREHPASCVRHLRLLSCLVFPTEAEARAMQDDLAAILENCTNLKEFAFHMSHRYDTFDAGLEFPGDVRKGRARKKRWLNLPPYWFFDAGRKLAIALSQRCASGLRELDLDLSLVHRHSDYHTHLRWIHTHLFASVAPTLTVMTLRIGAWEIPGWAETFKDLPSIEFARLDTLWLESFDVNLYGNIEPHTSAPSAPIAARLAALWITPRLVRLTLAASRGPTPPLLLLEAWGAHLTYLAMDRVPLSHAALARLPAHCPALTHVVLNYELFDISGVHDARKGCVLASPTLRVLDLVGLEPEREVVAAKLEELRSSGAFPELQIVRAVPPGRELGANGDPRWFARPEEVVAEESVEWHLPGRVHVRQLSYALINTRDWRRT